MRNGKSFIDGLDLEERAELFLSLHSLRKKINALEEEVKRIKDYLVFTDIDDESSEPQV